MLTHVRRGGASRARCSRQCRPSSRARFPRPGRAGARRATRGGFGCRHSDIQYIYIFDIACGARTRARACNMDARKSWCASVAKAAAEASARCISRERRRNLLRQKEQRAYVDGCCVAASRRRVSANMHSIYNFATHVRACVCVCQCTSVNVADASQTIIIT